MQSDRVAQVFAGESRGSGYLIAPSLVLTAAHVIDGAGSIEVRTVAALERGDRTRVPATLLRRDAERDLALLAVPSQEDRGTTLFGTLSGQIPVPVDALGFPDAMVQNGRGDTFAVNGDCHPQSGLLHGRLQIRISSLVPQQREDWAGLSGAAVFAGSHLIGVMRSVPAEFASGVLEASAVGPWLKDDALSAILRSAGLEPVTQLVDADAVRPFGAAGFDAVCDRYRNALLSSFRLDGAGLAVDGATHHALALDRAYAGTRYGLKQKREPFVALADERRLVLLGAPGSGKSITLKRLLATVSQRDGRVPVFLRLADFAVAHEGVEDATAATFIQAFAERAAKLGVADASDRLFERLLVHGHLAIALDGFDEIGGKSARERVARAIGQLSDAAPNVRIIVASRPAEYAETPLPKSTVKGIAEFVTAETLPLEGEEPAEFLRICFDDDGSLWREIRVKQQLREMARTPLLLTLLAVLGGRGRLPENTSDILAAIVGTALESWETSKRRKSTPAVAAQARDALEDLALAMQQRDTPAAPLAQAQAMRAMGASDSTLLDWLVNRTGLLVRHEQHGARATRAVVQLAHLQLQEYLAGCALARRLASGGEDGWSIIREWGGPSRWREPQRFAAAELARDEAFDVLEMWIESLIETAMAHEPASDERLSALLFGARLLAEADAEFLPATKLEARLVNLLEAQTGIAYGPTIVNALCSILPRPASLAAIREIALQTSRGLGWFGHAAPPTGTDRSMSEDEALAACIRGLCEFGDPDDARHAIDWMLHNAGELVLVPAWPSLAPWVERLRGLDSVRQYLRDLAFSKYWAASAPPSDILRLLDAIDIAGYAEIANELALEGAERDAEIPYIAGFVQWLEAHADPGALPVVDRYYERLREVVMHDAGSFEWPRWWQLPIWPHRESAAADALREEVLRRPLISWYIINDAVHSGLHRRAARAAWLRIARDDFDRSRRLSLINTMIASKDDALAIPLLLDTLGSELPDRWSGEAIVRHLRGRGRVAEVKQRLSATLSDPSTTEEHAATIQHLLEVCDE